MYNREKQIEAAKAGGKARAVIQNTFLKTVVVGM